MIIEDERTPEQKKTHRVLIVGTDSFLSGCGKAEGGVSYAVWACKPEDADKVYHWVSNRGDMKRVREVRSDYKPKGKGHCHIYVVDENHRAIK